GRARVSAPTGGPTRASGPGRRRCGTPDPALTGRFAPFADPRTRRTRPVTCQNRSVAVLVLLLATVVTLLGVLVAGLLRSHAEIIRSLHDLGVNLDPDDVPAARPVEPRRAEASPMTRPDRDATDLVGTTPRGDAISVSVV